MYDVETNLNYNYHRSYDSNIGSYTTSDPIGFKGGWNTYAYVNGNPVNLTGPSRLLLRLPMRPPVGTDSSDPPGLADYYPPMGATYTPPSSPLPPEDLPDTTTDPVTIGDIINPDPVSDETQCPSGDKCSEILAQIEDRMKELNKRYMAQCKDKKNQWADHKIQFDGKKRNLAKLVKKAEAIPCIVPQKVYEWLRTECPAPGTDRNTSPGY